MTSDVARFSKTYKLALCYKFFAAGAKNLTNLLNLKDCVPLNLKIKYPWFNVKGRPISVDKTYIPRLFFSPDYTFNATSVVYTKVQYFFFITIYPKYFITFKSSTTRDPPRPLPGARVRNMLWLLTNNVQQSDKAFIECTNITMIALVMYKDDCNFLYTNILFCSCLFFHSIYIVIV
jgi:hypothetical protein